MKIKLNTITQAVFILSTGMLLNGCGTVAAIAGAAAGGANIDYPKLKTPVYDIEPQVIYRIDNNRYVTLEDYPNCELQKEEGFYSPKVKVIYHDDKLKITSELSKGVATYKGVIINAAKNGTNIGFVTATSYCFNEKGCSRSIVYSVDSGQTWRYLEIDRIFGSNNQYQTKEDVVIITDEAIYKSKDKSKWAEIWKFNPEWERGLEGAPTFIDNRADGTTFLTKDPKWSNYQRPDPPVKTPSGMERMTCDPSIKPRSIQYID